MRFEFATAGRIIFGPGCLREAGPLAAALGRRALVVGGRSLASAFASLRLCVKAQQEAQLRSLLQVVEQVEQRL